MLTAAQKADQHCQADETDLKLHTLWLLKLLITVVYWK